MNNEENSQPIPAQTVDLEGDSLEMPEEDKTEEQMLAELDALGMALGSSRSDAINFRQSSGIERVWQEDQEFYEGVDDANRHEEHTSNANWVSKPAGQATANTTVSTRSRIFPNITGPFVDAAVARICDMLLPTDDRPWAIKPTPIPELDKIVEEAAVMAKKQEEEALTMEAEGVDPAMAQDAAVADNETAEAGGEGFMKQMGQKLNPFTRSSEEATEMDAEEAEALLEVAKDKARAAEKQIEDWHIECQWHSEVRKMIEDSGRIGVGVLKGPIPVQKKLPSWGVPPVDQSILLDAIRNKTPLPVQQTVEELYFKDEVKPATTRVDPWNFYPMKDCGEDIQNGSGTWEREFVTKKQMRELANDPSYLGDQITKCIVEGPFMATGNFKPTVENIQSLTLKDRFEMWTWYGQLEREQLEAAGCDCTDIEDPYVSATVIMVNNHVIKATRNLLETGEYPYDVFVWRQMGGTWTGQGVARQIRTAQKIVTAGYRNLMDNAGIAAGPMLVFKQGVVRPSDGVAGIAPRKVFFISQDDETIQDATKAIGQIKVDMMVDELLTIVHDGMKMAEDTTGLPMLLQGQMGSAPDTVGGMTMLQNNSTAVLRRLAKTFDDRVTERAIRRDYVYLLQYGEDEDAKGDYLIDARGSSALVERDVQNQQIAQMGNLVLDPRYGIDPKKWMQEYLKSIHYDTKRLEYDDDQWQQMMDNWAQMMAAQQEEKPDPRLEIAGLNNQTKQMQIQAVSQDKAADREVTGAVKLREIEEGSMNKDLDRQLEQMLAGVNTQLDGVKLEGSMEENRETIKAMLAKEVMKIRSTERLVKGNATSDQLPKPPVEPTGKAPAGKSYTQ